MDNGAGQELNLKEVQAFGRQGSSGDCKCGIAQRSIRSTRIVGGQEAEVNEWPWMAAVMILSETSNVFCGGSIISDEWILTAAHCFKDKNAADMQVLLAEHNVKDNEQPVRMGISDIILHKDYNFCDGCEDNDFALLKMTRKIDWYANPNIRPVCLPSAGAGDFDQWMSTATGWGLTSKHGDPSDVLLEVNLKVLSENECRNEMTPNRLCAEIAFTGNICNGDSGGPLVACGPDGNCGTTTGNNYDLIGIASMTSCRPGDPATFARVTAARQWIDDTATGWKSGTCPRV